MSEARVVPIRSGVVAENFRAINKGAVVGTVDIIISAWHLKLTCLWINGPKGQFISLPSNKYTTRDGKTAFRKLVEFTDDNADARFQAAAVEAAEKLRRNR